MSFHRFKRVAAGLIAVASLSACAPRFYDRSTVSLDTGDDAGVQVHFGELDSCLVRQEVPVEYIVRRAHYTLHIHPVPGLDAPPRIELNLQSDQPATLQFPTLMDQPKALYAEKGTRYLVESAGLNKSLNLVVIDGSEELGREHFHLSPDHCRVLSPN